MKKTYSSSNLTRTGLEEFESTLIDPKQKKLYQDLVLPNISRDPLSHVLSRRVFFESYVKEFERAKHGLYPDGLAFILICINEYELICAMDDQTNTDVLHETGKLLKESFRSKDIIGRFADDSFSIVLTEITKNVALSRAKDLIYSYSNREMSGLHFSISAGLAYFNGKNHPSVFSMIEKAEEKLDKARLRKSLHEALH